MNEKNPDTNTYIEWFYNKKKNVCDMRRILGRNTSVIMSVFKRTVHRSEVWKWPFSLEIFIDFGELCLRHFFLLPAKFQ